MTRIIDFAIKFLIVGGILGLFYGLSLSLEVMFIRWLPWKFYLDI